MNIKQMIKFLTKLISLLVIILLVGCETTKIQSSRQLLESELLLLDEFLNYIETENNPEGLNNKDFLTSIAVDTIDNSNESGMMYFEMKTGTGDLPTIGTEIGYRYVSYRILTDTAGISRAFITGSNYYNTNPEHYIIGEDAQSLRYRGIYPGVTEAIRYMRLFGKSTVIVPSPIGANDFVTQMYELEITYMSK